MTSLGVGDVRTPEAQMEEISALVGKSTLKTRETVNVRMIGTGEEWGDLKDDGDDVDEQQYVPVIIWKWVKARGDRARTVTDQFEFSQLSAKMESQRIAELIDRQVDSFKVSSMIAQPKWKAVVLQWLATFGLGVEDWDIKEPWYGSPGTNWGAQLTKSAMKVVAQRLKIPVPRLRDDHSPKAGPSRRVTWSDNLPDRLFRDEEGNTQWVLDSKPVGGLASAQSVELKPNSHESVIQHDMIMTPGDRSKRKRPSSKLSLSEAKRRRALERGESDTIKDAPDLMTSMRFFSRINATEVFKRDKDVVGLDLLQKFRHVSRWLGRLGSTGSRQTPCSILEHRSQR